ncbi:hypothetical protein C2G38_2150216 [Gigaspora rosea]|uniref:Uncharacterized protein n=1 Tax=Gigaspora rosea TaxID=44941 RepID=A0A397U4I2_9GLOM|nr:hypothetical protein C2G38_2150216 [Gigaspora rosea]
MRKHGFTIENESVLEKQIQLQLEINRNLMQQSQEVIDKIEEEVREFTLNVLVSHSKQVAEGHKRKDESFEECAIRETLKEANVAMKELNYVDMDEGFRVFPDKKECLFRTLIYFTILEDGQMNKIISTINGKFLTLSRKRKRKKVENESNIGSPEINITDFEEMITGEMGLNEMVELNGVVDLNRVVVEESIWIKIRKGKHINKNLNGSVVPPNQPKILVGSTNLGNNGSVVPPNQPRILVGSANLENNGSVVPPN